MNQNMDYIQGCFNAQMKHSSPLTFNDPEVRKEQTDYLENRFGVGDWHLYALFVDKQTGELTVASVSTRSFEELTDESKFLHDGFYRNMPKFWLADTLTETAKQDIKRRNSNHEY